MKPLKLNVQEVSYHRNGVCGEGFYAVRFRWEPDDSGKEESFLAILFDGEGQCAVLGLDRIETMGVAFARGNSWRGDQFEGELRRAIETEQTTGGVRLGPFCLPV